MTDTIRIWTDGACSGNPGPGGWGALIINNGQETELYGSAPSTTNNRMELKAAIEALNSLEASSKIELNTDSTYVKDGLTKWIHGWKRNGWKTAAKKPVKNKDLWQALDEACSRHQIEWKWVKGHAGDEGNERADALAVKGSREAAGQAPVSPEEDGVSQADHTPPHKARIAPSDSVHIWTDGACSGNPGPGGWGALVVADGQETELFGSEKDTTNNRMELAGAIEALNSLTNPSNVILNTDSTYVKDGLTKWIHGWKKNGWKTAAKKPVKNKDLWQALDEACSRHKIEWKWVKGHAGDEGNERADALAVRGSQEASELD
nr:ribonuclease HI [Hirschia maritima]